ncbi:MAG: FtsW/RodA/SpoVE family cell cycle protein, partial [Anaerolineae bacterium]
MIRRSWRNFDYILLGALLILSAYGVIMIYSATINTLGVDNPVQRQILYIIAGTVVLLVTASVDYRLLLILQVPISVLTPLLLGFMNVGLAIIWRLQQGIPEETLLTVEYFSPDLPVMIAGVAVVFAIYVLDRIWVRNLDLVAPRIVASAVVLAAMAAIVFLFARSDAGLQDPKTAYLLVIALALLYLLDCLTLRYTDTLHNPLYVLVLGILGVIFLIGQVSGGSQRWIGAGAIQPSELSKVLMIVVLAKFLSDHEEELDRIGTVLTSLIIVGVPMLLIYLQPDLGTALTMIAIWAAMIWLAGMRFRHLALLVAGGLAALP